ncbi:MAG: C-GCAxxG-C-C family protein [Tissierellia bacterium]|nr:C-GCAxxG-C-C family protein [Tissierellia bacterium]
MSFTSRGIPMENKKHRNCAQKVLGAFAEDFAIDPALADGIASAFGGGRFRGETCGCVVAANMVLGLAYGHDRELLKANSLRFEEGFKEIHGSVNCSEILREVRALQTPAKVDAAKAERCSRCIDDSIAILRGILENHGPINV